MAWGNYGGRWCDWHGFVGAIMILVIVCAGPPAMAEDNSSHTSQSIVALEVSSWLLTAPYGAAKAAYALGGSIVAGLAWVGTGGDAKVARSILVPAVTGDYIVRPENLSGQRPLNFIGKGS